MMRPFHFLFLVLLLPAAAASHTVIDITVAPSGLVHEDITLHIDADQAYDDVRYRVGQEPVAVLSDDPWSYTDGTLIIERALTQGENTVSFGLLFDDLILEDGDLRVLQLSLRPESETLDATLTLPRQHVLANTQAPAIPEPDTLRTDGQSIILGWERRSPLDLAVTYEVPPSSSAPILIGLVAILAAAGMIVVFRKRERARARKPLRETLTDDERFVFDLISSGNDLQKQLVRDTGFSKSKMSKVVRRLELKGAIHKEPHMKTNRLLISDEWA